MRVVEPHAFKSVKQPKQKRRLPWVSMAIVLVAAGYFVFAVIRPLPVATASLLMPPASDKKSVPVAWPTYGQAAIGAVGYGVLGVQGEQISLPTASVAKIMTALAVLKQRPLSIGEQGPIITITQDDVDEYARTIAMDGSNVPVALGEEITQYQALQALLLPSANNMAYTLVKWAYGSEAEYLAFVNTFTKSLGMTDTTFDDASGYSPGTASTSQDLVRLAVNAMDNPVIAEIASQKEATIPVAGRIYNVNILLGREGIVGVKTGNTEQAGGVFMAAAVRDIGGQRITAVSVIMGAPNISIALRDSVPLVTSVLDGFEEIIIAIAGQEVGMYNVPWGPSIPLTVKDPLKVVAWRDSEVTPIIDVESPGKPVESGEPVGTIKAQAGRTEVTSNVVATQAINEPTIMWRLRPRL